eukprot:gb/GECG01008738.1/.p1 GENE.gb/GECG01008738.1/~~gb/GECG01008738.1/.p1  ORF type:complete len:849 (+),score=62.00 gb/GECG01008738.1/:1-2547(+)
MILWGTLWWLGTIAVAFIVLTGKLYPRFTLTEVFFASIPVGTIGGAWITFLVSCLLHEISFMTLSIATIGLFYIGWDYFAPFKEKAPGAFGGLKRELKRDWVLWVNLAGWGAFVVPLFSSRFLPEDEHGNVYSGGSCWSDLAIHLHIAHSFLYGRNQDVAFSDMYSPVFAGEKMAYPFLPDWHAAILKYMGDPMRFAMMLPGIAMFFSLVALLFSVGRRMVRSDLAATVAIILIILAGGMGGINLSRKYDFERIMMEFDPIQDDVGDKGQVFWFAFLPHVYFPQRGATFAYPMVLTILMLVWAATSPTKNYHQRNSHAPESAILTNAERRGYLLLAGTLSASLPLVQAHSFIALGILIGLLFLLESPTWLAHPVHLLGWIPAGIVTVALAVPQLSGYLGTVLEGGPQGSGTFMDFRPIWSPPPFSYPANFKNYWWFWWRATGPMVPIATAALLWWSWPAIKACVSTVNLLKSSFSSNSGSFSVPDSVARDPTETFAESDGSSTNGKKTPTIAYGYGGLLRKIPTPEEEEGLNELIHTVSWYYAPIQDFAIKWESMCEEHNRGRVLDTFKLALSGAAVWAFGNYVMLQPWDRDNCKLLYIALFICLQLSGKLLVFPFEHLYLHLTKKYEDARGTQKKHDDAVRSNGKSVTGADEELMRQKLAVPSLGFLKHKTAALALAACFVAFTPLAMYYSCYSGALSVTREYRLFNVLYDPDSIAVGEYMRNELPPKGVTLHRDTHLTPAGFYAGRPCLVSFAGWMWSHGYDYHERHRDREFILSNLLKESDGQVYGLLRRWGVRYVLAEHPREFPRDESKEDFDPDLYLDNQLKRIKQVGRFHLFEVLGYDHPPT